MSFISNLWSSSSSSSSSPSSSPPSSPPQPQKQLSASEAANPALNPLNPKGLKPCCACPETKKSRDDCFLFHGSNVDSSNRSSEACEELVRAHRECMAGYGFKV